MNKRGLIEIERQAYFITYLVLVAIVAITLMLFINKSATAVKFNENLLARDISLLLDSAQAANGDLEIKYVIRKPEFLIEVGKFKDVNSVFVIKKDTPKKSGTSFYYAEDTGIKKSYNIKDSPNIILIKKEGNTLEIENE